LLDLFKKGTETKPKAIEEILNTYPGRQFFLVGDSGEQDPEVYAQIAQKYPDQISKIFIRNVTDEVFDNERFKTVFGDLSEDRWELLDDARDLILPKM
jgi:phosphatidate phosphatase APP1